jgi:hypothetical protein
MIAPEAGLSVSRQCTLLGVCGAMLRAQWPAPLGSYSALAITSEETGGEKSA